MYQPHLRAASEFPQFGRDDAQTQTLTSPDVSAWSLPDLNRRFDEFLDYAATAKNHSSSTIHGYRSAFLNFRHFLKEQPTKKLGLRVFAIEEWVRWNRRRGLAPISLNTYFRQLRSFFSDLEKRDRVPNPFRGIEKPRIPSIIPKARSPKECRQILAAAENYPWRSRFEQTRAVAIIGVFLYAGLRRGEVLRLQFNDVNVGDGTIRVTLGKGPNGGKDRVCPIAPELKPILQTYLRERVRRRYVSPGFFTSTMTGQGISLSTLLRVVEKVRRASGINFSIHSLRHSFVTMLLASGVPLHVARDLAGHSNINVTAGYLRVFDEDRTRQIAKLRIR